jgi:hypothetical protein
MNFISHRQLEAFRIADIIYDIPQAVIVDLCPQVEQPRLIEVQNPDHGRIVLEASLH